MDCDHIILFYWSFPCFSHVLLIKSMQITCSRFQEFFRWVVDIENQFIGCLVEMSDIDQQFVNSVWEY